MILKELKDEIVTLKKEKGVAILAHYYQPIEIQEVADYLGDSLGLSRIANEKVDLEYIIFAGVLFMAETASILNQKKHIFIPSKSAGCPLASFLSPKEVKAYRNKYPNYPVITYVNSTAAVKAESDVCCTSSNAVKIVEKACQEFDSKGVLFGPDKNLASYTEEQVNIEIIKMPENGHCYVHSRLSLEKLKEIKGKYPKAKILVHPECNDDVRHAADFIGSTAQMYNYVKQNHQKIKQFIIGTEIGLLERMKRDFPNNFFYLAKAEMICEDMKMNSLDTIKNILLNLEDSSLEVRVPENIAKRAIKPINRMLEYS